MASLLVLARVQRPQVLFLQDLWRSDPRAAVPRLIAAIRQCRSRSPRTLASMTDWLEYQSKLTPEQVSALQAAKDRGQSPTELANVALRYARQNIIAKHKATWTGPEPDGLHVGQWETNFSHDCYDEAVFRRLTSSPQTGGVHARVQGVQHGATGRIELCATVSASGASLSEAARELAEALAAAADEVEQMNEADKQH